MPLVGEIYIHFLPVWYRIWQLFTPLDFTPVEISALRIVGGLEGEGVYSIEINFVCFLCIFSF